MSEADTLSPKRFRSPPYPAIDLAKAIERARSLYAKALHHPVQSNVLADAWKYGVKSSGLWATAAALIQYGLMTDQGSGDTRRFQLTDAAIRIIKDADPASEKRAEAVKRAALAPPVFKELWDQYGGAEVSDVVVRNFLTLDRREAGRAEFSDTAANDIMDAFKSTIDFAGVTASDTLPDADEGKGVAPEDTPSSENKPTLELGVKWPNPASPPPPPPPPVPATMPGLSVAAGVVMRTTVLPLPEGDVTIIYPAILSGPSRDLLREQINSALKGMELAAKAAPILYPDAKVGGETGDSGETNFKS